MKKYTAVLAGVMVMIAASWAWADVAISPENFPDEVFGQYLLQFDADGDGVLSVAEIEAIDGIDVQGMGIKSLEGIGYLTAIKELNCRDNSIETLDLHGLTELEIMRCGNNSLAVLDLGGLTNLAEAYYPSQSRLVHRYGIFRRRGNVRVSPVDSQLQLCYGLRGCEDGCNVHERRCD